jgi:cAMP phosphodiesterase
MEWRWIFFFSSLFDDDCFCILGSVGKDMRADLVRLHLLWSYA